MMRVGRAVIVAVLTGAAITPPIAATTTTAAGAATNPAITIRGIDREGNTVAITGADLRSLSGNGADYTLSSSSSTGVAPGSYNLAAWVWEPGNTAATLADEGITITSNTTVTFDARKGHKVQFTVDDSTVTPNVTELEPFSPSQNYDAFSGWSTTPAAGTYVIPGKLPSGWEVYAEGDLIRPNEYLSPVEYQLIKVISGSIPSNPVFASYRSQLARDNVTVRSLDGGGQTAGVGFVPMTQSAFLPAAMIGQWATPPYSLSYYFSPGYRWQSCVYYGTGWCAVDNINPTTTFSAGHTYSQTFGNAVWGPSAQLGVSGIGNQLSVGSGDDYVFNDPTQENDAPGLPFNSDNLRLYEGSKLLAQGNGTVNVRISSTPEWYTMMIRAYRGPGTTLANTVAASFRFRTWANAPSTPMAFWPRIIPPEVTWTNTARARTIQVPVWFTDLDGNVTAHGVAIAASYDGGTTWHSERATQSGNHWYANVTSPSASGYVSLRVSGHNSSGAWVSVTILDAYRAG
jgi:hypothetical protein